MMQILCQRENKVDLCIDLKDLNKIIINIKK